MKRHFAHGVALSTTILCGMAGPAGCGKDADPQAGVVAVDAFTIYPEFRRPPQSLEDALIIRTHGVASLQTEPMGSFAATPEVFRSLLLSNGAWIDDMAAATERLQGDLPAAPELNIGKNEHLLEIRGRLLVASRVLQADAIRAWEADDIETAADRTAASFRIAAFLHRQSDEASRMRSLQIGVVSISDLAALCRDGFTEAAPQSLCATMVELGSELRDAQGATWPDETKLAWDDASRALARRD
jgi:hypothetical protein